MEVSWQRPSAAAPWAGVAHARFSDLPNAGVGHALNSLHKWFYGGLWATLADVSRSADPTWSDPEAPTQLLVPHGLPTCVESSGATPAHNPGGLTPPRSPPETDVRPHRNSGHSTPPA